MPLRFHHHHRLSRPSAAMVLILSSVVVMTTLFLWQQTTLRALEPSWLDGDPVLLEEKDAEAYQTRNDCSMQDVQYVDRLQPGPITRTMCVTEGDGFRVSETRSADTVAIDYGISVGSDTMFYKLSYQSPIPHIPLQILPGTTKTVIPSNQGINGYGVKLYKNILEMLEPTDYGYYINEVNTQTSWKIDRIISRWGFSEDGHYVVYAQRIKIQDQFVADVLVRANTETDEKRIFDKPTSIHPSYPIAAPELAVSNDGLRAAGADYGALRLWQLSDGCLTDLDTWLERAYSPCPNKTTILPGINDALYFGRSNFLQTSSTLDRVAVTLSGNQSVPSKRTSFSTSPTSLPISQSSRLQYLAMGDSYSSGEGDVSGNYYLPGTEGRDECHLSSRSYPYVLAKYWKLQDSQMKSIACSGARILFDYFSTSKEYLGQGKRLEQYAISKRNNIKKQAMTSFFPGVNSQVDFIKMYQPRIVTVTGGGNDVGFADILKYCAIPGWESLLFSDECSYAHNKTARESLINSIHNQYGVTRMLLKRIARASPQSKTFVISYPQFIKENLFECMYNAGALSNKERAMIREMVAELNNVLWRAATDEGIPFVDIENALEGGQLCGGGRYMTGLHKLGVRKIIDKNTTESFHPNSAGHLRMATVINEKISPFESGETVSDSRFTPEGEMYSSAPLSTRYELVKEPIKVSQRMLIALPQGQLQPGSNLTVTVYSNPVSLGTHTVRDDGSLKISVALPVSLSMGYHLLLVEGKTYSGEPITFYQQITIASSIPNDMDGDGVPDDKDSCQFIQQWIDEVTGQDVCAEPESISRGPNNTARHKETGYNQTLSTEGGTRGGSTHLKKQAAVESEDADTGKAQKTLEKNTKNETDYAAVLLYSGLIIIGIIVALQYIRKRFL